jgi:hypothetical protein
LFSIRLLVVGPAVERRSVNRRESMAKANFGFLGFIRLVMSGEIDEVSRHLAANPALATAAADVGATRRDAATYFISEIAHYLYAGDTALHMAAAAFRRPVAELLVSRGADCRARNRNGAQPLHYAADANHWDPAAQAETIEYLLSAARMPMPWIRTARRPAPGGADKVVVRGAGRCWTAAPTPKQQTRPALRRCTWRFSRRVAAGAVRNKAREQQAGIIKLLLERGARPADKDKRGKPVRQAATSEWIRALL